MKRAWINIGVGVGCVGLLLALTVSWVLHARDAARLSHCKGNLKQWGTALWNYHDIHQCFPPYSGGPASVGERLSGRVLLLPYLNANDIWFDVRHPKGFEPQFSPDPMKLVESRSVELSVMLCPSSFIPPQVEQQRHASYAFCGGDQIDFGEKGGVDDFPNREETRGIFGWRRCVRDRDITDGTANTIAMAERNLGGSSLLNEVRGRVAEVSATSPAECIALASGDTYSDSVSILSERMGERWASGHPFYSVFLTAVPPNGPSCAASAPPSGASVGGWLPASSQHGSSSDKRGCHVLMCDGTVRFINESINHETKWTEGLKSTKPLNHIFPEPNIHGYDRDTSSCYGIWGGLGAKNDSVGGAF